MTEAADMYVRFITSSSLFLYVSEFLHNKNMKQKNPWGKDCALFLSI